MQLELRKPNGPLQVFPLAEQVFRRLRTEPWAEKGQGLDLFESGKPPWGEIRNFLLIVAENLMDVELNRRDFMSTSSRSIVGASLVRLNETNGNNNTKTILSSDADQKSPVASRTHDLSLSVNNEVHTVEIDVRTTLLDLLREQLALTGTKKGCDHGACGACTVHVGGKRVLACLTLAATLQNAQVTTIEGVAKDNELHSLQTAFVACEGLQCGYCTPGQIMSGLACIQEGHTGSAVEIQEWMSGNLCRCGAYPNIVDAINVVKTKNAEA